MIVRVYIDDSGTDPKDQRMTLAALVGSLRQWQSVEPELKKLNRRFGLKEFRGSYISGLVAKGEWPPQKADQFIEEYAKITSRLLFRPSVSMNLWDYKEIFPSPSLRSRTRPEYSEIGVCFVFLLDILLIQTLQRRPTGKPIFHVVMEDRQGAGVTDQLWAAFKEKIIPDNLKSPNLTFAR